MPVSRGWRPVTRARGTVAGRRRGRGLRPRWPGGGGDGFAARPVGGVAGPARGGAVCGRVRLQRAALEAGCRPPAANTQVHRKAAGAGRGRVPQEAGPAGPAGECQG